MFDGSEETPPAWLKSYWRPSLILTSLLLADLVYLKSKTAAILLSSSCCCSDCFEDSRNERMVGSEYSMTVWFGVFLAEKPFCKLRALLTTLERRVWRMLPSRIDLSELFYFLAGVVIVRLSITYYLNFCISLTVVRFTFSDVRVRCFEASVAEAIRINLSGLVDIHWDLYCLSFRSESLSSIAMAELSSEFSFSTYCYYYYCILC